MPETPAHNWLLAQGHNDGGHCVKCWDAAILRAAVEGREVATVYSEILGEAQDAAIDAVRATPTTTGERE